MQIYRDPDADLALLHGRQITVIGYGNQGRAQALNLRDSGLAVLVGNREDEYAKQARQDGLECLPIAAAVAAAAIILLLLPDEIAPAVYHAEIAPHLAPGKTLVFASGYNLTYNHIAPPAGIDVVLVAPRMIGAGVRELYQAGRGFPAFFGVAQDGSGRAREAALALCKGIGATRAGVVEVTFAQETELDLFTEQCFGPAFGQVLMSAVNLLLDEGYPPGAVLLELYMSGEFAYTLRKMAQMGTVAQSQLHSVTSQYGSFSRGMRFMNPELRARMAQGLDEIRSGAFAREFAAESAAGYPTLESLRETALELPLHQLEQELIAALDMAPFDGPVGSTGPARRPAAPAEPAAPRPGRQSAVRVALGRLQRVRLPGRRKQERGPDADRPIDRAWMEAQVRRFLEAAAVDPALASAARGRDVVVHYRLTDLDLEFHMDFHEGQVSGDLGPPPAPGVTLTAAAAVLDGVLSGATNAVRAALSGKLSFEGDARLAMGIQPLQPDLIRLYTAVRRR